MISPFPLNSLYLSLFLKGRFMIFLTRYATAFMPFFCYRFLNH